MSLAQPLSPTQRNATLDKLRGFALFGVLVVNLFQDYSVTVSAPDRVVSTLLRLLGEGSFYPLFSLLFGLGFALYLRKGEDALKRFRRRLVILLFIGLAHGYLVWRGDILASYALVGLLLPRFRTGPSKRLMSLALGLALLSGLLFLPLATNPQGQPVSSDSLYATGHYWSIFQLRSTEYTTSLLSGLVLFGPQLFAFFLVGLVLGRRDLTALTTDRRFLSRVFSTSLALALPLLALSLFLGDEVVQARGLSFVLEYFVASPLLGFSYLAGMTLLLQRRVWQRLLRFLAPVGRMALSNYLAQSLICTYLFYGYGLGLYGQLGSATTLVIGVVIFAVQASISTLWLQVFRFGPAEWLWRSLTYGSVQPLRNLRDTS